MFLREDVGSVKFDVRYIVLLRSVKPLGLFAYDVFWLRFSNRYPGGAGSGPGLGELGPPCSWGQAACTGVSAL